MAERVDALIVGYGPVGQVMSLLLARRGWQVAVVERWLDAFPMPRAVAFDSEGARILAAAGIGAALNRIGEPSGEYTWRNAEDQTLLHVNVAERGLCGWPESISMHQPSLEAALTAQGAALENLVVHRGNEAVAAVERGDGVEVTVRDKSGGQVVIPARWVIGCDGAKSFVRQAIGASIKDFGFSHDWLICDVIPHQPQDYYPNNLQICDPARPRTEVSAGPGHRRWEFMRIEGEKVADLNTADSAWRLLELFGVRPDNATLERQHVYTFEASYAQQWRRGRILLAGDACHLMPPFAGQGMTSGFRDVMNLAWKLDLVLRDQADAPLLDSYMAERQAHVQHAISMSVNLGRIICQTDHRAAADRDTVMLAAASRPVPAVALRQRSPLQPLKKGLLHHGPTGRPSAPAGVLLPQGRVARDGEIGLFDDIVGLGFVLLCARRPADLIDAGSREFLAELGAHLVHVLPADQILDADQVHTADVATADAGTPAGTAPPGGVHTVVDLDGVYLSLLAETSSAALLVRPDFYAFGGAADRAGLNTLVDDLRGRLRPVSPPAAAAAASELEPPVVAR